MEVPVEGRGRGGYGALMQVDDGDLLIARLWRWDSKRLRQDAEKDRDEQTQIAGDWDSDQEDPRYYSVSAFGLVKEPGESVEDLMRRVCQQIERRAKYVSFATKAELDRLNITTILNEPPPNHYDLSLGTTLRTSDVEALERLLSSRPKRRFPTCEVVQAA